ncbi:hypothetical protein [Nonomuraea longicatena]|uniref:DUF11 domain-containing protein n=1 Tax=Nonomuraea longicatena TaxID=83682 RepID=A0ABP3ZLT7_9ACTN
MLRRLLAGFTGLVVAGAPGVALADDPVTEPIVGPTVGPTVGPVTTPVVDLIENPVTTPVVKPTENPAVKPVVARADLSVRITSEPAVAQPGQPIAYRVEVANAGPGDAVLPVLVVSVPPEVRILHTNVATCRPGTTSHQVRCASATDVRAGGGGGVTITGLVGTSARGPLRTVAKLTSATADANERDNTFTHLARVDEGADLGVRLTGQVRSGGLAEVTAVIGNRGPRMVRDAFAYFRARGRLVSSEGARCRGRLEELQCGLRALGAGERMRVRLLFEPERRAIRATVFSSRFGDREPSDNESLLRLR